MNGDDLVAALEDCTLPGDRFHHADHLHAAWTYLRRFPTAEAIGKFSRTLRRYTAYLGKADRYHETITWAYLLLLNERIHRDRIHRDRIHRGDQEATWEEFSHANPDLFDWERPLLRQYYREETLGSDLARSVFVMPDKL